MPIYQQHSAQGSILTPQNSGNRFGFYYDKQTELPPYHSYISYNTVGKDEATARQSHYDVVYDLEIARMSNDDCNAQPTYGLDRGAFRFYRNDTEAYRKAWLSSFQSAFYADSPLGRNAYNIAFKQYIAGDDEDPVVAFPSESYEPDSDFSGYDDEAEGIIHVIGDNGSHQYFDLQGRPLISLPRKGVYISQGKKVVR